MRYSLEKYLKFKNVNIEEMFKELNIDINKDDYSFEEIQQISYKLRLPIKNLFAVVSNDSSKIYNVNSFMKAVEEGKLEEVLKSIVGGCVTNVSGRLYFGVAPYRISPYNAFNYDMMLRLIEFLLEHKEIELARRLSSKNIYYKFNSLSKDKFSKEVLIDYLFGDECEKYMLLTDYTYEIYISLDDESKKEFEKYMVEKYEEISKIHNDLLTKEAEIIYEKSSFSYFEQINEKECSYHIYYVDDIYKLFGIDEQKRVEELLKPFILKIC